MLQEDSILGVRRKMKTDHIFIKNNKEAEKNYEIYDKKPLAIVKTLTKQRQYLLDATEKFEV